MKTLIASALVATAALTGTAQASLSTAEAAERAVQAYAPFADLSGLTTAELTQLVIVIHSSDSEGEKRQTIRNYLR